MSVATGKFVDNTGSSCLNLESFVSSVPTIEELFSTMMENSAAARLSNVITTMLQSVNTEGDDAHDLSGIYTFSTSFLKILVCYCKCVLKCTNSFCY